MKTNSCGKVVKTLFKNYNAYKNKKCFQIQMRIEKLNGDTFLFEKSLNSQRYNNRWLQ